MKFGVCSGLENAELFAKAGYNFIELNVFGNLKPEDSEMIWAEELHKIKSSHLPAKAANCFVPGQIKIVGDEVDDERLEHYVEEALERAAAAGIKTVVFGSGGARKIPDGFDRKKAYNQLIYFGQMVGLYAKQYGVTVVVEPLNTSETNIFNTVGECARYVNDINHPNIRLLVDAYHWARENDSYADLVQFGPLLGHAHIATYTSRCAPGLEECNFTQFFQALKEGGYNGTLSIEGSWSNLPDQARSSLDVLQRLAEL